MFTRHVHTAWRNHGKDARRTGRTRERAIPEPDTGSVRLEIEACGICDSFTKEGTYPGIRYPRVPGHEIAGVIDKLGPGVEDWTTGRRVGIGWHGGHCGHCDSCRRGDFIICQISPQVPGITTTATPTT